MDADWSRIVLGTVQIGVPYGRTKNSGVMPEAVVDRLLSAAWTAGIRHFDTAEAYGVAAERLSAWLGETRLLGEAHVITKIVPRGSEAEIATHATDAIERFRGARSTTLLTHGSVSADQWPPIEAAGELAGARVGQSVYDAAEVSAAWPLRGVKVVQAPANVFDQRAISASHSASGEMHYRSVFLQGLLLDTEEVAEKRVAGAGRLARSVAIASGKTGVPAAALLAASVLRAIRSQDKIVVGADNADDLDPLKLALCASPDEIGRFVADVSMLKNVPEALLDPRTWQQS